MRIPVFVECDRYDYPIHRGKLSANGLKWNGENGFSGNISRWSYENTIRSYCRQEHLKCRIDNEYGSRSSDYRKTFFRNNRPAFAGFYFCAYCGKPLTYRTLTVDHLYPVGCAKDSVALQKKLSRMGIKSINDPKNLVAACFRCNREKSKRMGRWITRGKIGRSGSVWMLRHTIRILVLAALIVTVGNMICTGDYSLLDRIWNGLGEIWRVLTGR